MTLAAIPSPSTAVWHLLGLPIRAYALCIVLGIVVACLVTEYRLRQRGVAPWAVLDMAVWAVPFGIVGARLYHVITSPQGYFGDGGTPIKALYIWEGGLGIWGGVAGGALGAYLAARQLGLPLSVFADSLAPGLPLAQAVGRFGNWFNNELYGKVTTLPWGLQVHDMDREHPGQATLIDGQPVVLPDLYHPTFLYESLWDVGVAVLVLLADRKYKFGRGRGFALYVMAYTVGRFWIELLRTDEANHFFGIRLNVFTSIVVFIGALLYFLLVKGPRGYVVPIDAPESAEALAAAADVAPLDAPAGEANATQAPPVAYQEVSFERFEAYRRTGILPPATAEPAPAEPVLVPEPALTAPESASTASASAETVSAPLVAAPAAPEAAPTAELSATSGPSVKPDPVVVSEPTVKLEPVVSEPTVKLDPVVVSEPTVKPDPAVESEPTVKLEPVVSEPAVKSDPVVESEPTVKLEPVVESELAVKSDPVAETESSVEAKPAESSVEAKPAESSVEAKLAKPAVEVESGPVAEAESDVAPKRSATSAARSVDEH